MIDCASVDGTDEKSTVEVFALADAAPLPLPPQIKQRGEALAKVSFEVKAEGSLPDQGRGSVRSTDKQELTGTTIEWRYA